MSSPMIEQPGRVTALEGNKVRVETQRETACGHCSSNSGCGVSIVGKVLKTRAQQLLLPNTIDALVGDRVLVGTSPSALLRASILLYLMPLTSMVLVAVTLSRIARPEGEVAIGSLLGLLAGFFIARRLSRNSRGPQLLRIVRPAGRVVILELSTGVTFDE